MTLYKEVKRTSHACSGHVLLKMARRLLDISISVHKNRVFWTDGYERRLSLTQKKSVMKKMTLEQIVSIVRVYAVASQLYS